MIEILLIICFIFLFLASIFDIRTREIPDWLNYGIIVFALLYRLLWSFFFNWTYFFEGLAGFGVAFILACVLFYTGQWGGGDAKSLMGVGALLGMKFSLNHDFVSFLINLILAGAIYSIFVIFFLTLKNKQKICDVYNNNLYPNWKRIFLISILLMLIIIFVNFPFDLKFFLIAFIILAWIVYFFTLLVFSVEKVCMIKLVKPSELTEGDWIVKDVKHKNKLIVSSKNLGLTLDQIERLKKLKKKVWVKNGIPFLPSFLLAFILTFWLGNLLRFLIF